MIGQHATLAGTQRYAQKHQELSYKALGSTGLLVSEAGFGGYRVSAGIEEHFAALRQALLSGINLLDTSANYADGGSEELIADVLRMLAASGEVQRDEVVLVSKVGYLQGQNYTLSQTRKEQGRSFPELVEYAEGLEHCIHPEFIADQLTRSLTRLGVKTLDCYLLHNPEYYLSWAKQQGIPRAEARHEYIRRITVAFTYLEEEVARGRIRCYGISSNTFPRAADDYEFTPLAVLWNIAQMLNYNHHFRVIEFPLNLLETNAVTEINQPDGQSVLTFAREKRIGVLINRPLNAIVAGQLIRLAEAKPRNTINPKELELRISGLIEHTLVFKDTLLHTINDNTEEYKLISDGLDVCLELAEHWGTFETDAEWQDAKQRYFQPVLQETIELIMASGVLTQDENWLDQFVRLLNQVFQAVAIHYQTASAKQAAEIRKQIAALHADWAAVPTLSQLALRVLRSTEAVSVVLVGMRREEYVRDVLEELFHPVTVHSDVDTWAAIKGKMKYLNI